MPYVYFLDRIANTLISLGSLVMEMLSPSISISSHLGEKLQPKHCFTSRLRIKSYLVSLQLAHQDQSAISGLRPEPVAASQSIPAPCTTAYRVSKNQSRQIKQYFPQIRMSHAIAHALTAKFLPRRWDARGILLSSAFPIGLRHSDLAQPRKSRSCLSPAQATMRPDHARYQL